MRSTPSLYSGTISSEHNRNSHTCLHETQGVARGPLPIASDPRSDHVRCRVWSGRVRYIYTNRIARWRRGRSGRVTARPSASPTAPPSLAHSSRVTSRVSCISSVVASQRGRQSTNLGTRESRRASGCPQARAVRRALPFHSLRATKRRWQPQPDWRDPWRTAPRLVRDCTS